MGIAVLTSGQTLPQLRWLYPAGNWLVAVERELCELCTYQWFAPEWGGGGGGGVGQPMGIWLRKAHMGWDFDITAIPRVGDFFMPISALS